MRLRFVIEPHSVCMGMHACAARASVALHCERTCIRTSDGDANAETGEVGMSVKTRILIRCVRVSCRGMDVCALQQRLRIECTRPFDAQVMMQTPKWQEFA
jgi:hypothetical protein